MKGTRGELAQSTPMIGKAGEYAVSSQLMYRNGNVLWPSVDMGYDLLCENGCRVQVKTAHLRISPSITKYYPEGIYSFHFPKKRKIATSAGKVRITDRKPMSESCDVVVLVGIEQNRYWVVPSSMLDGVQCIFMGPKNARAFSEDLPNMKEMVKLGYSQAEIGKAYGMSQAAISHRLNSDTESHADSKVKRVRECENAWEYILDFQPFLRKIYTSSEILEEKNAE